MELDFVQLWEKGSALLHSTNRQKVPPIIHAGRTPACDDAHLPATASPFNYGDLT